MTFVRRHWMSLWQVAFLLSATTWLFAPYLNYNLSDRETLISEFSLPGMPYYWVFRVGQVIATVLLVGMIAHLYKKEQKFTTKVALLSFVALSALFYLFFPTVCNAVGGECQDYSDPLFIVQISLFSISVFLLSVWDAWKNKRTPSKLFVLAEIIFLIIFLGQVADQYDISTITEFTYQAIGVVWLTWFLVSQFDSETYTLKRSFVNKLLAFYVAAEGVIAIVVGAAHLQHFNKFQGIYFGSGAGLIGNHGVLLGVAFIYLSRHLARGERRAWQILLVLVGIEILKFSAIVPHPIFLLMYLLTFVGVFISREFFGRGVSVQTWRTKIYDVLTIAGGVIIAVVVAGYLLSYNTRVYNSLNSAYDRTQAKVAETQNYTEQHVNQIVRRSVIAATLTGIVLFVLWTLFRPARFLQSSATDQEIKEAADVLDHNSQSTEDFFKIWPKDKLYFWSQKNDGFIAYKVVGSVAFALADPIARTKPARKKLLDEFNNFCKLSGLRACFLLVSHSSKNMYEKAGLSTMQIGASALIDIEEYVNETGRNKWWRWQRNKGTKMNYSYEVAVPPHSDMFMQNLKRVSDQWLKRGGHKEEGFALGYFDTDYLQQCRIHTLRDEHGYVVAFVNELPVYNNLPQTTIDLIRFVDDAPNANNFLLYNMLHRLQEEGNYERFDIGFVPLAQMRGRIANIARRLGANRFSAAGLEQFKGKFEPNWEPNYIAYDGDLGDLALIALHLENAMAVDLNPPQ